MNVASLDLCRELHELSGWAADETDWVWAVYGDSKPWLTIKRDLRRYDTTINPEIAYIPAYDLGYLLRRLPKTQAASQLELTWNHDTGYERWECGYVYYREYDFDPYCWADTPEDAAAKLAIELFKQGVLSKEVI